MAARFVYWMNVSLDLLIESVSGENGGGSWMHITEELHREFNARARDLDLMVQGRKVYEIMEDAWPAARTDSSMPDVMREYGEIWTAAPKILVSRTRTHADYNTQVYGEDAIARLAQLRADSTGVVGVGGATLATALLEAGLLDELLLFTHPAILGSGRPLFDRLGAPLPLDLIEEADFPQGVGIHRYRLASSG